MTRRPGWYADPWGGPHRRWWDGALWTEYVEGERLPPDGVATQRDPHLPAPKVRSWWQSWWVVLPTLFMVWVFLLRLVWPSWLPEWVLVPMSLLCWGLGLVLVWTRDSTPPRLKLALTLLAMAWMLWLLRPLLPGI